MRWYLPSKNSLTLLEMVEEIIDQLNEHNEPLKVSTPYLSFVVEPGDDRDTIIAKYTKEFNTCVPERRRV